MSRPCVVARAAARSLSVVGLALAAVGVAAGSAQEKEAALRAHIDSLLPLVERARADAAAAESALEERRRLAALSAEAVDTIVVGDLTVLAPPGDAEKARVVFEKVWMDDFSRLRDEVLPSWTFTFQVGERARPIHVASARVGRIETRVWERPAAVERRVRAAVAAALREELRPLPVHAWASDDPLHEPDGAAVYRRLATTPSRAVRSCLAGDLRACTHALGLDLDDDPLPVWYTAEERRRLVAMRASGATFVDERGVPSRRRGPASEDHRLCLDLRDVDACDRVLGPGNRSWAPLAGSIRTTLLRTALQRGGEGAWSRLVESVDRSPAETLEHVSGASLTELVGAWRDWVLSERAVAHAGLGRSGLLALLWISFFATLASRSTRWRSD